MSIRHRSICLLLTDPLRCESSCLAAALTAAQWTVTERTAAAGLPADVRSGAGGAEPALVLLDMDEPLASTLAADLRARGGAGGSVPVLLRSDVAAAPSPSLVDAVVPRSAGIAAAAAAAAAWRPDDGANTLDRLAVAFGARQVERLAAGLRDLLVEGLARAEAARLAHRIVGFGGSLGFATVASSWRLMDDEEAAGPAWAAARRDARVAIAAIDRWRSNGPS